MSPEALLFLTASVASADPPSANQIPQDFPTSTSRIARSQRRKARHPRSELRPLPEFEVCGIDLELGTSFLSPGK